jgi:hypothetical protein
LGIRGDQGVIGAHSGICRPRMNPSGNAAVNSRVVAWRCGHLRLSRSSPAQARRAVPARRHRYDTAIFSMGISSIYMDGMRCLEHAFVDGPVLNCAPLLVNVLDGERCLIPALSKIVHRKRLVDSRSTRAAWVLPLRVPKARKPAVRC